MKRMLNLILIGCALLLPCKLLAQDNMADLKKSLLTYKAIYKYADSLQVLKQPLNLAPAVFAAADSLNNYNPQSYFIKAGALMNEQKYREASFIYYLGMLRMRYHNAADPNYRPDSGGALLASFQYVLGEPLDMFLKTDIDSYHDILKACSTWVSDNDYKFFPKNKNPQKYADQIDGIDRLVADLEKNKAKYKKDWTNDRAKMEKNVDETLLQINKILKSGKNKKP